MGTTKAPPAPDYHGMELAKILQELKELESLLDPVILRNFCDDSVEMAEELNLSRAVTAFLRARSATSDT